MSSEGLISGSVHRTEGRGCAPRAFSVACLVSMAVLFTMYYIATEDSHHYLAVPTNFYNIYNASTRGYLVQGARCQIPDIDPYDKDIRKYVRTVDHMSCSKEPALTRVQKAPTGDYYTLHVAHEHVHAYSKQGVVCCYSNITRTHNDKKPDDSISISPCRDFENSVNITQEFILVKCVTRNRKKEVYKNAHAVVLLRPDVRKKIEEESSRYNSNGSIRPLSVLLIGIDSISRLNSLRTMPHTLEFLNNNAWIELRGYNKIADNTFPNLMALLTGTDGEASYDLCEPTKLGRLEKCNFIWTRYSSLGYVTAYAEDSAPIGTFNYQKVGFTHLPTEYYLRPFMIAAEKQLRTVNKYNMRYCVGPESEAERILSYASDFAMSFATDGAPAPGFGLFWMNSFSHNDLNEPSGMDQGLLRFVQRLHEANVTDNAMIIFFSDHGIRFGEIRNTMIGWLEERLPFIYIHVPEWFARDHPVEYNSLRVNAARLTTPYDLHMTLQDVLVLSGRASEGVGSSGCPSCHSLFREIDVNRSCEDAGIPAHWCTCTKYERLKVDNDTVRKAARYVVAKLHQYVKSGGANAVKHCATITLNRVLMAQLGRSWSGNPSNFLLFIETMPGRAKFEATVSVSSKNGTDRFQLHSSVSRLDSYAGQSGCVKDANLKKYCYCR